MIIIMNKILSLLISIITFASIVFASPLDQDLVKYQKNYTFCHGNSNYQITKCLLNGQLNYSRFRGDRYTYRKIDREELRYTEANGQIYPYVMSFLPKTRRYIGLMEYLNYLYSIMPYYTPPQFMGNSSEDMIRMKRVFNLLHDAKLIEDDIYTMEFEAHLLAYQERHGLTVDGDIGPSTQKALKQSIESIISKVKKNLELERISSPKGANYILVNIPEFKMHYYENYEPVLSMKVIVGKKKMRTPIFNRKMKYIVKNPRWNIPKNIYNKEYAHKSEEALRKQGLVYNSEGKLYQPSGKRNALGVVKFLFPNKYNVYMHDTPSKHLFNKRIRAFSHGCIRLEKPLELLNKLGYQYTGRKNKWITVENRIPVYVEYHTVWIDDEGIIQFRPDIYGYEKKLFR